MAWNLTGNIAGPPGDDADATGLVADEALARVAADAFDAEDIAGVDYTPGLTRAQAVDLRIDNALDTYAPGTGPVVERLSNFTTTAGTITAATAIPALSLTVVGTGRPVDIEFFCPSVTHTTSQATVSISVRCNDQWNSPQSQVGGTSSASTTAGLGDAAVIRRSGIVLADGVSYTFTVHPFTFGVTGTATLASANPYQPMQLSATFR